MGGNLTAKLTSNGAATAGYQYSFALDIAHNLVQIDGNRVTAQQILHVHIPDFAHIHLAVD